MLFSPHNLLVFIFLSALFLFNCFFADFLINLPKYIISEKTDLKGPYIVSDKADLRGPLYSIQRN